MTDRINIQEVEEWEYNAAFRGIKQTDIDRLDKNSEYGQHSTLLIYFSPEGRKIAVGGNNRLRRWKNDPNFREIAYIKLEFGIDDEGYFPILDGRVYRREDGTIPHHFKSIEDGMLQLALSHNGSFAFNLSDEVANMIGNNPHIDWSMFDGAFVEPINYATVKKHFEETDESIEEEKNKAIPPQLIIEFETAEDLLSVKDAIEGAVAGTANVKITMKA